MAATPFIDLSDAPFDPTGTIHVVVPPPIDLNRVRSCLALVAGDPDPRLVADLGKALPSTVARDPVAVRVDAATTPHSAIAVTPLEPLSPRTRYSLVLGACLPVGMQALGRPIVRGFQTDTLDRAAPIVSLVAPLADAPSVVRNLAAVDFRVSRAVTPLDVDLVGDDGVVLPSHLVDEAPCDGCRRLRLDAALSSGRRYLVRVAPTAKGADGRAVFGAPPGFTAGTDLRKVPIPLGAVRIEGVDRCAVARFSTDQTADSQLCRADACVTTRGVGAQLLALALDDAFAALSLSVSDESTRPVATVAANVTLSDVPLVMTEILTEPLGSHDAQQFVELHSRSAGATSLDGLTLVTAEGRDPLPAVVVPAGGFAVVAARSFSTDDGLDAPAPPTATLARVAAGRLGGYGLRVGQPVWIEDARGAIVTRWSAFPVTVAHGQSVVRSANGGCDVPASFVANPTGSSTPGGP